MMQAAIVPSIPCLTMATTGEFLIYSCLEDMGEEHKLLANVYLPKGDGKTTETDLIMISATGIYVFESKNYSGWIFGDENSRYWKQIFRGGRHYEFYNPHLAEQEAHRRSEAASGLGRRVFRSYIVFSERCVLKNMFVYSPEVKVMNQDMLACEIVEDVAQQPGLFTSLNQADLQQIESIRPKRADEETKQAHIDAMKWRNPY